MKVTHFNRDPRLGNFTFEQLFGCLRDEMSLKIQITNRNMPANMSPLEGVLWAKRNKGEMNHITGDVNYLAFGLPPDRTIITVHDIGHYSQTLKGWKKNLYKKFWLKGPLNRVNKLTAISNFTKNEVIKLLNIPEKKIEVIPNPLLPGFNFCPINKLKDKITILQVGSGQNKNLSRLIEAAKGLPVRLLLLNKLFDARLHTQLELSNLEYEQRVDLNFKRLIQAYQESDVLYFASEYEGFGMPILEAQATGRPVITSNIASMPEVAGEKGAILVNPFEIQEIREAIITLINDTKQYKNLIQAGLENVKKYDISKISQQYIDLYKKL